MIPGHRASICLNMVQFGGICIIHLPDLLFGNFPGTYTALWWGIEGGERLL